MKFDKTLFKTRWAGPLGPMIIAASDRGIAGIWFAGQKHMPEHSTWRTNDDHPLFAQAAPGLHFTDHVVGNGPGVRKHACEMGLEGVISKRLEQPYMPGNRGLWLKSKCLNREEFIVVGWTDPANSRSHFGALLLGYYTDDGRLRYAGRAGSSRWRRPACSWPSRRRARTGSVRRLNYRRCSGRPRWW